MKTGIRAAKNEAICITDADGTYPNNRIPELFGMFRERGLDMVVGRRSFKKLPTLTKPAKWFITKLANFLVDDKIPDINSGLRIFRRSIAMSGFTGSGDEVWIYAPEGYLVDMGKVRKRLSGPPCGELVGVSLLSPEGYSRLCIEAERLFSESLKVEYETALVASSRKKPIACHLVPDLVWGEIDDESHLQRAKTRIYPRLS